MVVVERLFIVSLFVLSLLLIEAFEPNLTCEISQLWQHEAATSATITRNECSVTGDPTSCSTGRLSSTRDSSSQDRLSDLRSGRSVFCISPIITSCLYLVILGGRADPRSRSSLGLAMLSCAVLAICCVLLEIGQQSMLTLLNNACLSLDTFELVHSCIA